MKKILFFVFAFIIHNSLFINHCESQWVRVPTGLDTNKLVLSFASNGNNIFSGIDLGGGVYCSTNNGNIWTQTALNDVSIFSFAINDINIFAGSGNFGVYRSTNDGTNWSQTSLNVGTIYSLAVKGNYIFAGIGNNGIFLSTNNGVYWEQTALVNKTVEAMAINENYIFAGTDGYGIYFSTNSGTNWIQTALNNQYIWSIATIGNNIIAGTGGGGVFLSSNNGTNWIQTSLNNKTINTLAISGNNIFAGTTNYGIYLSTNYGANWIQKNQGLMDITSVFTLLITNNYIFAGTNSSVWRRSLFEIIGINQISKVIPSSYSLSQNYPNPFNSNSKIKIENAKLGNVKLIVYDIIGRDVETLINEKLQPGTYEVTFDGSNLNSGVYFYRLTSDGFTETKRMILLK